jgi:LEA14-like dessication related protein
MPQLILLAAVGAAFYLYTTTLKSSAGQINAVLRSVDVKGNLLNLYSSTISVKLQVTNPGNADVVTDSFTGTLYSNGSKLATVNYLTKLKLKARTTATVDIPVRIDNFQLLAQIITAATKSTGNPVITIKGAINSGAFTQDINSTTTLNIK